MTIDTDRFFAQALATARRNRPYALDARQAAREALQEAHSSMSQAAFFAVMDALGGEQAVLERLEQAHPCPHAGEWQWLPQDESGEWECMTCGTKMGQELP